MTMISTLFLLPPLLLLLVCSCNAASEGQDTDNRCIEDEVRVLPPQVLQQTVDAQLVQMCEDKQWKYICDENWTSADATVACRQLGFLVVVVHGTYEQIQPKVLSYIPQCSGQEQNLTSCSTATTPAQCTTQAWVICSNESVPTSTNIPALIPSKTYSTSTSSPSIHSPRPPSQPEPSSTSPSPSQTPISPPEHPSTTTPSASPDATPPPPPSPVATPSDSPDIDDPSTSSDSELLNLPLVLYAVIGSVVIVLFIGILILCILIVWRRYTRHKKLPVVEDHTYDQPFHGKNQMYLEMAEHNIDPLNSLKLSIKYPNPEVQTSSTKHTLQHSPATPSKMGGKHEVDVPVNEILYDRVIRVPPRPTNHDEQQKPPLYQVVGPPSSDPKSFYHTLERDIPARLPHSHQYHTLESPTQTECLYSEVVPTRRAASLPRIQHSRWVEIGDCDRAKTARKQTDQEVDEML